MEFARLQSPGTSTQLNSAAGGRQPESVTRRAALRTGLVLITGLPAVLPAEVSAQGAAQPGRLVLKHKDLAPRIHAYFKKISKDKVAQKAFVENPTRHLLDEFLPPEHAKSVSPQRVSNANRFLYAALANEKFRKWVDEYQQHLFKKKEPDRAEVLKDFSKALAEHGGPELMLAILDEHELTRGKESDEVVTVESNVTAVAPVVILFAPFITSSSAQSATVIGFVGESKEFLIPATELRSLSEQLLARADALRKSGQLMEVYSRH